MLSGRFIHLIESHWDEIMARVVEHGRREPHLSRLRAVVEPALRDWGQDLLRNLGHWLAAANEEELARRYHDLGRLRFEQEVPLHESVRALLLIREVVLDYIEEQIVSKNTLELYAEEELDRRLSRFFDLLTIYMVEGYEKAMRKAVAAAV